MKNMAPRSVRVTRTGIVVFSLAGVLILYAAYTFHQAFWPRVDRAIDMRELLSVSIDLARRAGDAVKAVRVGKEGEMDETVKGKTKEGKDEMITNGDRQSHRIMWHGLAKAFPGIKVVSEERDATLPSTAVQEPLKFLTEAAGVKGSEVVRMSDITVWIDPLDATQEYTENLVEYVTTMVCVALRGKPTIGVIYKPFTNETVWGYVGHGHSPNFGTADGIGARSKKVIVSRSHAGNVTQVVKKALGQDAEVIPAGGAGYKVLEVIANRADAYVHTTRIKKWDICAGNAVLHSIEGRMTTLKGQNIDYSDTQSVANDDGLLATVRDHDTFLRIFRTAMDRDRSQPKLR